jgi:tRNA U34 5-carboxymethylaminomethyl modifying enzyme MnmG/GidA
MNKKNNKFSDLNKLNEDKYIDAIEFKKKLQENALKRYHGKSSHEIMECINKNASKSKLYRKSKNR